MAIFKAPVIVIYTIFCARDRDGVLLRLVVIVMGKMKLPVIVMVENELPVIVMATPHAGPLLSWPEISGLLLLKTDYQFFVHPDSCASEISY